MLGKVIGEGCIGKTSFYMGISTTGAAKDKAFWSARCSNGKKFAVEVNPDGTNTVLDCPVIEAMHAGYCFKKLSSD